MKNSDNKKLKIVILADALDNQSAGVHYYTDSFVNALNTLNCKHEIIIIRERKGPQKWSNIRTIVLNSPQNLIAKAKRYFWAIPKKVRELNADWVIEMAHFGPFNLDNSIRRSVFIHDLTPVLFPEYHQALSSFLQKTFLPSIFRRVQCVFVNSNYTQKDCLEHYPQIRRIEVLRPGYNPSFYKDMTEAKSLGRIKGYPYILSVGTLEPRKNLVSLIQAFEYLKAEGWTGKLVLTGSRGWKNQPLDEKIEKSPFGHDIVLTGYVSIAELRRLYSQCSLFVYPSKYEGFGLPILEALSCGAKVLASSTSSMPEVGGEFASYFDPDDVDELHRQLIQCLAKKNEHEQAQIDYAMSHQWLETARRFIEVVEEESAKGTSASHD